MRWRKVIGWRVGEGIVRWTLTWGGSKGTRPFGLKFPEGSRRGKRKWPFWWICAAGFGRQHRWPEVWLLQGLWGWSRLPPWLGSALGRLPDHLCLDPCPSAADPEDMLFLCPERLKRTSQFILLGHGWQSLAPGVWPHCLNLLFNPCLFLWIFNYTKAKPDSFEKFSVFKCSSRVSRLICF